MLVLILFVSINVIDFIFNKLTESFFFRTKPACRKSQSYNCILAFFLSLEIQSMFTAAVLLKLWSDWSSLLWWAWLRSLFWFMTSDPEDQETDIINIVTYRSFTFVW